MEPVVSVTFLFAGISAPLKVKTQIRRLLNHAACFSHVLAALEIEAQIRSVSSGES